MVDSLRYKDWIEKSRSDLKAAGVLKEHNCGNDIVAFHCQQSIEKGFKGFISSIHNFFSSSFNFDLDDKKVR